MGQLSSFLTYANQYTKPFNEVTGVLTQMQTALASAARLLELIDQAPETPDAPGALAPAACAGRVDVEDVSFSYVKAVPLIRNFTLHVQPGQRVLDMCAAPGGKSAQLAGALGGQGLLVANEYDAARANILSSNLERMGAANAVVLNEAPARIAAALPGWFDRVLVDAPCSGEGMFRKEPQALRQHSEALVRRCAALGAQILDAAAAALRPGGRLVYSTCTFAPEENEGTISWLLEEYPEPVAPA